MTTPVRTASPVGTRRLLVGGVLVVLGLLAALAAAAVPLGGDTVGGGVGVVALWASCRSQGELAPDQDRLDARCASSARRQLALTSGPSLAVAAIGAGLVASALRSRRRAG